METLCRLSYRGSAENSTRTRAADETLALPVDATLTKRDMQRIASACNALGGLLQPAL